LAVSGKYTAAGAGSALATFQDESGGRWIFTTASATAGDRIVAFKVIDENGKLSLASGWESGNLTAPLPPIVVNGLVFAVSSGEFRGAEAAALPASQR